MDHPRARILVMAKAPVAGRAKTRLEPLLGPDGCARLQAALVRHTVVTAAASAPVWVAVAGDVQLIAPIVPADVPLFPQVAGDLGARMAAAVEHVRNEPGVGRSDMTGPVIVVGTDCPQLGPAHVAAVLDRLAAGDDVVFGPAHDGGYYLVALASETPVRPVFDLPSEAWGGPQVLALSLAAAEHAGLRTALIDPEHDLDTPTDATTALIDPRTPPPIATLLHPQTTP